MKAIEFQNLLKVYLANNLDGARELADRFEVAISTVSRWRDGTARPHLRITQQIITYLQSTSRTG